MCDATAHRAVQCSAGVTVVLGFCDMLALEVALGAKLENRRATRVPQCVC